MEIRLVVDDRIVSILHRCRRELRSDRLALVIGGSLLCSSGLVSADTIKKAHSFASGTPIVASQINANFDQLVDAVNDRVVRSNQSIAVADCSDLVTKLRALEEKAILSSAVVTLKLAAGSHQCDASVSPSHPNGSQIEVVGATTNAADTVLSFANMNVASNGIGVARTNLGIRNLSMVGPAGSSGRGIRGTFGASVELENVRITGFDRGVASDLNSVVIATNVVVEASTDVAFNADNSSVLKAVGSVANIAAGTCYRANGSSYVSIDNKGTVNSTCKGAGGTAVLANLGSSVTIAGLDIDGSFTGSIISATVGSTINAVSGSIAPTVTYGAASSGNGSLVARFNSSIRYTASSFILSGAQVSATYVSSSENSAVYPN